MTHKCFDELSLDRKVDMLRAMHVARPVGTTDGGNWRAAISAFTVGYNEKSLDLYISSRFYSVKPDRLGNVRTPVSRPKE